MSAQYDVVVIGLGPAGSTASYYLAKAGYRVLALDKAKFPRIKPCGGGITSKGLTATEVDWSSCIEFKAHKVKLVYKNQPPLEFTNATPLIYMVSRPNFDTFLVKEAEKQGSEIRLKERVKQITQDEKQVTVKTENNTYKTKYVIGADGSLGITRKQVFPEIRNTNLYVAAETESCPSVRIVEEEIYFHLGSIPSGYGWIFGKGIYQSVGVYGSTGKLKMPVKWYNSFVDKYASHLSNNHVPIRVHPIIVYRSGKNYIVKGRVLLTGDAAGLVDPLLGEGIYYAMKSGRISAECLIENMNKEDRAAETYQHRIRGEIEQELRVAEKLAGLIYKFPGLSFQLFRKNPDIFQRFCEVLGGKQDYQGFVRELKGDLLLRNPILSRVLLGTERIRVLLSINRFIRRENG